MKREEALAKMKTDEEMTFGELLGSAMEITDQVLADEYYEAMLERAMRLYKQTRVEAEYITKSNLGYYAGYYSSDVSKRVNRLYRTTHPIFGGETPTTEEAFTAGVKFAESIGKHE